MTPPPARSALAPFAQPVFRRVWVANMASNFGGLGQTVGATWLMTSITPRAEMVTLIQASTALPVMLLALVAGAMADNFDRRRIMLWAQCFMLIVSATLAAITFAHRITPELILLFTFLIGIGTAFNGPAWQASVGDMVPREEIAGAVALNSVGLNLARSTGPAIAGAIVAAASAATTFAINTVSYLGLIVVLMRWRPQHPPRALPPEGLWMALGAGVRYAVMSPHIGVALLRGALFGVGASAVLALTPLIARDLLGGGPITYGLLLGSFGVGAIGGAFVSARLRRVLTTEALMRWNCVAFAAAAAGMGLSGFIPLTMALLAIAGGCWVMALSTFNVSIQMATPRWVVARALALYQMTMFGGMALGSWCWGLVAARHGIPTALIVSAMPTLLGMLIGLRLSLRAEGGLDLDPLRAHAEPVTALAIQPSSGPVVITIEYRIDEADAMVFLTAMAEWRRIRRRDGARNWTLLRDLNDPGLWLERYRTPTWLDYLRHNQRITKADAAAHEAVRLLHRDDAPPRVRRTIERQTGSLPGAVALDDGELVNL